MSAIENAGRLSPEIYQKSTLYTTLSPCPMCSGAILLYKIPHIIIGENKTFKGEEELLLSHGVKLEILNLTDCIEMMRDYIQRNSKIWYEDIGEIS